MALNRETAMTDHHLLDSLRLATATASGRLSADVFAALNTYEHGNHPTLVADRMAKLRESYDAYEAAHAELFKTLVTMVRLP